MDDEDVAREAMTLDPGRSNIVMLFGTKGRGKSTAARQLFDAWPHDRVVLDPTGNARPDDPHTVWMVAPFLSQLPEPDAAADPPQHRSTVWARIDPASPTYDADLDAALGMALAPRHRHKIIWHDEYGRGASSARMSPQERNLIQSSRHHNASALLVVQRPRFIPRNALANADKVLLWHTPDPDDREYIAKNFGVSHSLFEREYRDNQRRGRHSFLLLDRETDALINCPPLPHVQARGPRS